MSECDSNYHSVSVVVIVVVMNFFRFWTSSLKPLHRFALSFVWMFHGWIPTKSYNRDATPIITHGIMGIFVCNFLPIIKRSFSLK